MNWLALLAATCSLAQDPQPPMPKGLDAVNNSMKLVSDGKMMQGLAQLEKSFSEGDAEEKAFIEQMLATLYSFVGEEQKAMEMFDMNIKEEPSPLPEKHDVLDSATREDAIEAIVKASKGRQIVILNEAHHVPLNRGFGLQIARALRKEGFQYFAAETFDDAIAEHYAKGYPVLKSGFYSKEPAFGDLIRQTMKLGYKPVAYEARDFSATSPLERMNSRERQQSDNLIARIFKDDPKARVLIFCGYHHALEAPIKSQGGELKWMANRLKEATGIDPLTIDQTDAIPHTKPAAETPEYRYASAKGLVKTPSVFRKSDGTYAAFGHYSGRVDMQVFHPRSGVVGGRPDWWRMGGYRKPVIHNYKPETRVLLQAFVDSEPAEAIPMDQIIVEPNAAPKVLMLPSGSYRLVVQDASGASKEVGRIKVD